MKAAWLGVLCLRLAAQVTTSQYDNARTGATCGWPRR
jgi:hypothetical protein